MEKRKIIKTLYIIPASVFLLTQFKPIFLTLVNQPTERICEENKVIQLLGDSSDFGGVRFITGTSIITGPTSTTAGITIGFLQVTENSQNICEFVSFG